MQPVSKQTFNYWLGMVGDIQPRTPRMNVLQSFDRVLNGSAIMFDMEGGDGMMILDYCGSRVHIELVYSFEAGLLSRQIEGFKAWIAGTDYKKISCMAASKGMERIIKKHGFVEDTDKAGYYVLEL